ncbi:MAG: PKD domain-containing protein [Chloroflexi bacterium]|nr:PKD domain-containing protein [Chloroflexota bacterium]
MKYLVNILLAFSIAAGTLSTLMLDEPSVVLSAEMPVEFSVQDDPPTTPGNMLISPYVSDPVAPADTRGLPPAPPIDLDRNSGEIRMVPGGFPLRWHERMAGAPWTPDPAVQTVMGRVNMPAPTTNWEGISSTGVLPPDTDGQVGADHYVQIVNSPDGSQVRIWNKIGTQLYNFSLSDLWPGGDVCDTFANGDPIVLYDQVAGRWLLTQFALPDPPYYECVAVSKTGIPSDDPNDWWLYSFLVHNTKMNDYPKLGVWPDGYYMSANQFTTGWAGAGVWVFDRDAMLDGQSASFQYFDVWSMNINYGGLLPSNLAGSRLPPAGAPNYFMSVDMDWSGTDDVLHIFEFHTDWNTPTNSTFSLVADLVVDPFDWNFDGSVGPRGNWDIPQPGTSVELDSISDRLMMHLWYRNFGSHESFVVNHTVDVGGTPDHAGVRWYEIRGGTVNTTLDDAFIYQQGTYAPDSEHRWMGSGAMDQAGNIALGYSVSSSTVYPSIRYAGRLAGDPLGTLPQAEEEIIAGSGVQTHNYARWGDYSAMSVDPVDDCTFWYTQEYVETSGSASWQTRVASFQFPSCLISLGSLTGMVHHDQTGAPIKGATVQASISPTYSWSTSSDAGGLYHLATISGTLMVTATASGYLPYSRTGITVTGGSTTTLDIPMLPRPFYVISGHVRDADTGLPLPAMVHLPGTTITPTQTDPTTGFYSLTAPMGAYILQTEAVHYQPQSREVAVDGNRTEDFDLEPLCLLVVDDDSGMDYETFYTDSLDPLTYTYGITTTPPDTETLAHYGGVIWLTGNDGSTTLTAADRANLTTYLDGGGRLFLSGQNVGFDIGQTSFYADYLHADYDSDDTHVYTLSGLGFFSGHDIVITGGDGANNQMHPSDVEPVNGGVAVYDYPAPHLYGGVAYSGLYRTVYFAFGYEAINNQADRDDVMSTTLAYLGVCGESQSCTPISEVDYDHDPPEPSAHETVFFTATVAGGTAALPITYTWDFGDGVTRTLQTNTITHTFPVTTTDQTYTVSLTAANGCPSQQMVRRTITVRAEPQPCPPVSGVDFDYTPPEPLVSETVTFTATAAAGTVELLITYTWDFGDGVTRTRQTNTITHTFPVTTTDQTYTVSLTVVNGCLSQQTVSQTIIVRAEPQPCPPVSGVDFDYTPPEPLVSEMVTFTATAAAGTVELPITYTWDFGDGITRTLQTNTITHTFPFTVTELTYTVSLTIANACPSQQMAERAIIIRPSLYALYLPFVLKD